MTPPVAGHDGHAGPEPGLEADLLVVQHDHRVLVLVISAQATRHQGYKLINLAAVPEEMLVTPVQVSQEDCYLGPVSHLGKSSLTNSSQDEKS